MNGKRINGSLIILGLVVITALLLAACQPAASSSAANSDKAAAPTLVPTKSTSNSSAVKATPVESSEKEGYGYSTGSIPSAPETSGGAVVNTSSKEGLGTFLVDEKGMTLYLFTKDSPGVSNCFDSCLDAWPPLLTSGDPVAGDGVTGNLGTITRDDGTIQVTYDDMPLYYYVSDTKAGDTTGQGVGGVWYVVAP